MIIANIPIKQLCIVRFFLTLLQKCIFTQNSWIKQVA